VTRRIRRSLFASLLVSSSLVAAASPAWAGDELLPVVSADAGLAVSVDPWIGATAAVRGGAAMPLGRVAVGAVAEAALTRWEVLDDDVVDGAMTGVSLAGGVVVPIALGRGVTLEPAASFGAQRLAGDDVRGWLPFYGSTVAVTRAGWRLAVQSRIPIGTLAMDGTGARFAPDTELHLVAGWQLD